MKTQKYGLALTYAEPRRLVLMDWDHWAQVDRISTPAEEIPGVSELDLPIGAGTGGTVEITMDEWVALVRQYEPGQLPARLHCERA